MVKLYLKKKPIEMIHAGEILRPRMHLVDIEEYHAENEINNSVNAIISSFEAHRKECKIGAKMLVNTKGSEEQNEIINHPQIVEFLKNNPKVKIFDITSENGPRIKYYNNPNPKDTVKRSDFFKQLREMKDEEDWNGREGMMDYDGWGDVGLMCIILYGFGLLIIFISLLTRQSKPYV